MESRIKMTTQPASKCIAPTCRSRRMLRVAGINTSCGHFICVRCANNGHMMIDGDQQDEIMCLDCHYNRVVNDISKKARL